MNWYDILLFLHLVGAVAMFAGWAIEFLMLAEGPGHSQPDRGPWRAAFLGPVGMAIALLSGIAMMIWRWGQQPWMVVAIGAIALLIAVGIGAQIVARKNPADSARRRILKTSLAARIGMGLSLLAIMAAKPGGAVSIALLALALLAGVLVARLLPATRTTESGPPASRSP
ncbi:MAG TPA: hypothetical protein VFK86_11140 [Bauldia sp.]|nr:hypothetical protein [Bauldia sp.]